MIANEGRGYTVVRARATRLRRAVRKAWRQAPVAEVDANPNPLREQVFPLLIEDGWVTLADTPGLGVEPDLARLRRYLRPTVSNG